MTFEVDVNFLVKRIWGVFDGLGESLELFESLVIKSEGISRSGSAIVPGSINIQSWVIFIVSRNGGTDKILVIVKIIVRDISRVN